MDTQPVCDNGDQSPTLAMAGVTKLRCPACGLALTVSGETLPKLCPTCSTPLVITAATGETIEQAIAAVAQELPDRVEPVQGTIPGLHPVFDIAAALDIIEESERTASEAERAYSAASDRAKRLRKEADEANADLRKAIRDLNKRRHDARYEPKEEAAAEEATTAAPDNGVDVPVVDGGPSQPLEGNTSGDQLVSGELAAESATCARPDCPGDVTDLSNAGTLALLHHAGATNITLDQVDVWTEEQVVLARCWAEEQIEAHANDEPGKHTSVLWPEHVSLAHHGPEIATHVPTKRTKKPRPRRRS